VVKDRREFQAALILAFGGASLPAYALGAEAVVIVGITLALLLGVIPGLWAGSRGYPISRGKTWIAVVVALVAIAGLVLYTVGGPSEELFTRLVILPLSLVIAVAAAAVLIGVPMYAGYALAFRIGQSIAARKGHDDVP
jgi:hypothetical protein